MPSARFDDRWMDITPPDVPPATLDPVALIAGAVLLAVLIALALLYHNRPRRRARRALRRLARELRRSQIDRRPACFEIKRCLRLGLGQPRLRSVQWDRERQADWQTYLNRLTEGCFAPQPPAEADLDRIVLDATAWLNRRAVGR